MVDITKFDRFVHVVEYAVMGVLLSFGFGLNNQNFLKTSKYSFLVAIAAGATDEIHQCFVPGRSGPYGDLIADIIGCGMGIAMYMALINLIIKNKQFNE